jgi:hypothetical protein
VCYRQKQNVLYGAFLRKNSGICAAVIEGIPFPKHCWTEFRIEGLEVRLGEDSGPLTRLACDCEFFAALPACQ